MKQVLGAGERSILITWSLLDNGSPSVSSYNETLNTHNFDNATSILQASPDFLTPGYTYEIAVYVVNFLGTSGSTTWSITRSSIPTPMVQVSGPPDLIVLRSIPFLPFSFYFLDYMRFRSSTARYHFVKLFLWYHRDLAVVCL